MRSIGVSRRHKKANNSFSWSLGEYHGSMNSKAKFFLYARKSSESEDRQMASIESQVSELQRMADDMGLEIGAMFQESRSAKAPGRPVFNEMMQRIQAGEAQGILCWKLNRLARNPIDGGQISWMLQEGILRQIQTFGRTYQSTDNVIVMAVELGMANQFVRDLSTDTKRGLRAKAERGWYPIYATLGYMHNPLKYKGEKEILPDPERFPLVRKMWDLILTGQYNPQQVWEIARDQYGLKTRQGNPIARSNVYRLFNDPFYYGEFEYPKGSGNWHKGLHEPMVTRAEFDKVQFLLGRVATRAKTYDYALRGPIRCGECGALITAERKLKRQKNGTVHDYVYYHCTKRKDTTCKQKAIEEKDLEQQIEAVLACFEIPASFRRWAMNVLREQNQEEAKIREQILATHRKAYDAAAAKIDNLIDLRAAGEITADEFARRKAALLHDKERANELMADADGRQNAWLKDIEEGMTFAERARAEFANGSPAKKKEILCALGSNLLLKDKLFSVSLPDALKCIETAALEARSTSKRFEPLIDKENKGDLGDFYSQNPILLRG